MKYARAAWISLLTIGGIAAAVAVGRLRRGRTPLRLARKQEFEWDLADDLMQAVANALPDESGAFNTPSPNSPD